MAGYDAAHLCRQATPTYIPQERAGALSQWARASMPAPRRRHRLMVGPSLEAPLLAFGWSVFITFHWFSRGRLARFFPVRPVGLHAVGRRARNRERQQRSPSCVGTRYSFPNRKETRRPRAVASAAAAAAASFCLSSSCCRCCQTLTTYPRLVSPFPPCRPSEDGSIAKNILLATYYINSGQSISGHTSFLAAPADGIQQGVH